MRYVAKENGLEYGKDVRLTSQGSLSSFYNYLEANPNRTLFGVVFCTDEYDL